MPTTRTISLAEAQTLTVDFSNLWTTKRKNRTPWPLRGEDGSVLGHMGWGRRLEDTFQIDDEHGNRVLSVHTGGGAGMICWLGVFDPNRPRYQRNVGALHLHLDRIDVMAPRPRGRGDTRWAHAPIPGLPALAAELRAADWPLGGRASLEILRADGRPSGSVQIDHALPSSRASFTRGADMPEPLRTLVLAMLPAAVALVTTLRRVPPKHLRP